MNISITPKRPHLSFARSQGPIDLINATPTPDNMTKGKADRKLALIAMSFVLVAAVGTIALIIGSGTAQAANLPVFTAANALSAKQDAGVGGIAIASLAIAAFGALALFSGKKHGN